MKPRKPKDLAEKPEKPLRARYFEVMTLREKVKAAQDNPTKEADDEYHGSFDGRR